MKVVILAGGMGTRMAPLTQGEDGIPKPMLKIQDKTIIEHIIDHYTRFGFYDFLICSGYKSYIIEDYFSQLSVKQGHLGKNIKVVDTGLETMTAGRLKRILPFLEEESFLFTYGDGISDVDINAVVDMHQKNQALLTLTSYSINERFGTLEMDLSHKIVQFIEKKPMFINIGYAVMQTSVLSMIDGDNWALEKDLFPLLVAKDRVFSYVHGGFWNCMDTKEEYEQVCKLLEK